MLIAAMIWGSAFVAQRLSLDAIGPFLFTGLRFLLGALVVLTMIVCVRRSALAELTKRERGGARELLGAGVLLGVVLSASISDRKSTRLNSSHITPSRMPSSA